MAVKVDEVPTWLKAAQAEGSSKDKTFTCAVLLILFIGLGKGNFKPEWVNNVNNPTRVNDLTHLHKTSGE